MKLGYRPSPADKIGDGHPVHLLGVAAIAPEAGVDLPPPVNQDYQDCTANSTDIAVVGEMGRRPDGSWYEGISRAQAYFLSRFIAGIPLTQDEGSYLWATMQALKTAGFLPESHWLYTRAHVVGDPSTSPPTPPNPPDWAAYRDAADQRVATGVYRITSFGAQREADVAAAIAAGKVVVWGTALDEAFMDRFAAGPDHTAWPGVTGAIVGGHAMCLHRYRTNPTTGKREFLSRSSWGPGGDDGGVWVSADAVLSINAEDFWIIDMRIPHYSAEVTS